MSFKGGSDDIRSSLSYKLKRVLRFKAKRVLTTDPYVPDWVDEALLPLERVLAESDIVIIATPHHEYASLSTDAEVIDIWNLTGQGVRV